MRLPTVPVGVENETDDDVLALLEGAMRLPDAELELQPMAP